MTTSIKSILKNVGSNIFDIEPIKNTSHIDESVTKDFFIIGIGLDRKCNLLLDSSLKRLGIDTFSLEKNIRNKSKIKAMSHAAKIKYSQMDKTTLMPKKDFYWEQIFETKKKKFNGFIGMSAMNFCVDLINYYQKTHECRVIFMNENTQHWHRPVFDNLYNLENLGLAKDELDYLLYPQIELIRQLTSNYNSDIDATKKRSQNAFEASLMDLKKQIPSHLILNYKPAYGIAPLSQFLGIKRKRVFGW